MHGSLLGLPRRGKPAEKCIPYKSGPCGLSREDAAATVQVCGKKTERAGFEPAVSFWPTRHFQCRTFGRSVTSPAWAGRMDPAIIKRGAPSVNRLGRRAIAV